MQTGKLLLFFTKILFFHLYWPELMKFLHLILFAWISFIFFPSSCKMFYINRFPPSINSLFWPSTVSLIFLFLTQPSFWSVCLLCWSIISCVLPSSVFFQLFYASTEVYRDLIFLKLCLIFLPTLRHFFLHYTLSYLLNNLLLLLFCQNYFLKVFVKGSKNQIVIEHFHPTLKSYIINL